MKRIMDKKLPMFIICSVVIIGLLSTTTPVFAGEGHSSYGSDRTHNSNSYSDRNNSQNRSSSPAGNNSYSRDYSQNRNRSNDQNRFYDRYNARQNYKSRTVYVVHRNDAIPAVIATGIIAGITFSMLDNNAHAIRQAPPAICPTNGSRVASTGAVRVTAQLLNLRSGPGLNKSCVGQIRRGERLSIMKRSSGWYYVKTSGGMHGWVMAQYTANW